MLDLPEVAPSGVATNVAIAAVVPVSVPVVAAATNPLQPAYVFAPPANVITPAVLTEFFRPGITRTNTVGAAVFVPVEVNFTPPIPRAEVSSRATYKIQ